MNYHNGFTAPLGNCIEASACSTLALLLLVVGCTALAIVVLVITTGKPELALAGAVFVGKALHNFATMWYNESSLCASATFKRSRIKK